MAAHIVAQLAVNLRVIRLQFLFEVVLLDVAVAAGLQPFTVAAIQRNAILNVDAVMRVALLDGRHIVANLALQAHVRHQPQTRFRVGTGHVAGIGVAVGIAILHVEQHHEIIPVANHIRHCCFPPSS